MASAEPEPITQVLGVGAESQAGSRDRAPGQGLGGEAHLKLKAF